MSDLEENLKENPREDFGVPGFDYTPDKDIEMHQKGAIQNICTGIQSHENGLPEWIKNSSDAYDRINAKKSERVVVVIFNYGKNIGVPSISCLDFVGMNSNVIEKYFRRWFDPEAAQHGKKEANVQGGHGNGGKCYMVKMFSKYSLVHTVKNNFANLYGIPSGSVQFGYIPDRLNGKDFKIKNLSDEIKSALNKINCSYETLPKAAKKELNTTSGFSLFSGYGPIGYENKIPVSHLIKSLREHPQMIRSLQANKIFVISNNKLMNSRHYLTLTKIEPLKGAEDPRIIEIPSKLNDPASGELLSTTCEGKFHRGELILFTSEKNMRYGPRASRHIIRYINEKFGDFGYIPVDELNVQSPFKNKIYGECHLDALEQYKQNIRAHLAESPLTRAVQKFISEKIQEFAEEFERRSRTKYDKKAKDAISQMNRALDKWKNQFLLEKMKGLWGPGEDDTKTKGKPTLPNGKVASMKLNLTHQMAGKGVSLRPSLKFYDEEGRRIKSVPHKWVSEDNNVAMVDNDLLLINTFSYGKTKIHAVTLDGKIISNSVPLEVVHIKEINITPNLVELGEGGRQKLEAICKLDKGNESRNVHLIWDVNDPTVAGVSAAGFVFGFKEGETEVYAMDDNFQTENPAHIIVKKGKGLGTGSKRGKGYPQILISGTIDPDPDTGEYVDLSPDDPPVYQRAIDTDRNIWWINSSSPLASLYLDKDEGYGYESREWRIYHLERIIDVIVQIMLKVQKETESLDVNAWIHEWSYRVSEILPKICDELHDFITKGEINFIKQ